MLPGWLWQCRAAALHTHPASMDAHSPPLQLVSAVADRLVFKPISQAMLGSRIRFISSGGHRGWWVGYRQGPNLAWHARRGGTSAPHLDRRAEQLNRFPSPPTLGEQAAPRWRPTSRTLCGWRAALPLCRRACGRPGAAGGLPAGCGAPRQHLQAPSGTAGWPCFSSASLPRALPRLQGYGLTETCAATFVSYPDTPVGGWVGGRVLPAGSQRAGGACCLPAGGQRPERCSPLDCWEGPPHGGAPELRELPLPPHPSSGPPIHCGHAHAHL